jgi:opacity protein-like surface antigen
MNSHRRRQDSLRALCVRPSTLILLAAVTYILTTSSLGQSPSPSPGAEDRYSVKASTEIGARWVEVFGNENKFRSDQNYRTGFRIFDSSIVIEDTSKSGYKAFDSAMILASGWGGDPSGFVRTNIERDGIYRFDATVRRSTYFNFLNNHAIGNDRRNLHNADRRRNFGDIDLVLLPDNRNIRFRVGYSYNLADGTGSTSTRISRGDIFPLYAELNTSAHDFRIGADGSIWGFNLSGTYGYRKFRDRTQYFLPFPGDPGDVTNNVNVMRSAERRDSVNGETNFGIFNVQRTFVERFDVTAKVIHSFTATRGTFLEFNQYVQPTSPFALVRDEYDFPWNADRPQTRADLGMTWRITDKLRVSNTFTYDGFNLNGGNFYALTTFPSGARTRQTNYALTRYRRYMNLIEGDYQFNNRVAVNLGWRFTNRNVRLEHIFDQNVTGPTIPLNSEEEENSTNTFIAGTRFKPTKNWSVFVDIEAGKADNVFTRLANYEFFNYRIRSRSHFDKFAVNLSFISKDNNNPGQADPAGGSVPGAPGEFVTEVRGRIFSSSIDWDPINEVSLSGGYDYHHLTSEVSVLIPLGGTALTPGLSQYFVRDSYFFIDAHVRPFNRLTLFGSFRWDNDNGYGDRPIPALTSNLILGGYPLDYKSPEFRAAIRINKYIDWNVGYQYYDYKEEPVQNFVYGLPLQNYSAHMPYTSVRIYLGRQAGER